MAVYYSFHYDRDSWRVQQIAQMGSVEGQQILNSQEWEEVKAKGRPAIEKWIADNMAYKTAVVVLVGAKTSTRPWVDYEIRKAWADKRAIVGVRIHGLLDKAEKADDPGANPFENIPTTDGHKLSKYLTLHNPAGANSRAVYKSISDNMKTWADNAYKRS